MSIASRTSARPVQLAALAALFAASGIHAEPEAPPAPVSEPALTSTAPAAPAASTAPAASSSATPAEPTASTDNRPQQPWSFGVGAGWFFPGEILAPNTASVRVMIPQVVTIEPFVRLSLRRNEGTSSFETPEPNASVDDETLDHNVSLGLGANLRFPVLHRGNLDLQVLGGVSAEHVITSPDVEEGEEAEATNTFVDAVYGVGIEWFFVENIALSADALNPLVSWQRSTSEAKRDITYFDPNTGEERNGTSVEVLENTSLSVGAVFRPTVRVMLHLYF
jgi:hypothetical protein